MSKELKKQKKELDVLMERYKANEQILALYMMDDKIKDFIKIYQENMKLKSELEKINHQYLLQKMRECKHIFIIEDEIKEGTNIKLVYHCIKCGLNTRHIVINKPLDELTPLELAMKSIYFARKNSQVLSSTCPPVLAEKIVEGIQKKYPKIKDPELIRYFNAALFNIKKKDFENHLKHLGIDKPLSLALEKDKM